MTLSELKNLLMETGIPVSFSSVPLDQNTAKPYICFFQDSDRNFAADGVVYYSRKVIVIRLYTETRNETTESLVESKLSGMYFTKSIEFFDDMKIYEITYNIEV